MSDAERIKELETQLNAWFSVFGTNQLSHAIDRLECAEAKLEKAVEILRRIAECPTGTQMDSWYSETASEALASLEPKEGA